MKDFINEVFETQLKINKDKLNLSLKDKQLQTKETVLSLISEISEVLEEINWATYKTEKEVIAYNVSEEIIDIFKFTINLCLIWNVSPKQFIEEFRRKSLVVEQRFNQNKILKKIREKKINKICAIDLDGVIVDYPKCFVDFVNLKIKCNFKDFNDLRNNLPVQQYVKIKKDYRTSGAKKTLPINKGIKELIDYLKDKGYIIIILTKRPYKKYYRIFADTKFNLDSNNIYYDAILFDSQKHKRISAEFPQLDFIIEDDRIIANEISFSGYKCFLINNQYNQGDIEENVIRINDFNEIKILMEAKK